LTDTGFAPWHIIEAAGRQYRDISTGQVLISRLESALRDGITEAVPDIANEKDTLSRILDGGSSTITVLDNIDLGQVLTAKKYSKQIEVA